jgi:hypothetical protein
MNISEIIDIKRPAGRPSNSIEYKEINYNNKEYVIGKVKDLYKYFIIDKEDYPKIKDYS